MQPPLKGLVWLVSAGERPLSLSVGCRKVTTKKTTVEQSQEVGAEGSGCTLALQDLLSAPHRNIVLRSNAGGLPTGSHFTSQSDFPTDTTKECSGQAGGRDSENALGYFYVAVSGRARV